MTITFLFVGMLWAVSTQISQALKVFIQGSIFLISDVRLFNFDLLGVLIYCFVNISVIVLEHLRIGLIQLAEHPKDQN